MCVAQNFARRFAENLRTYAAVERRKYDTPAEYRRRATTWTKSDRRTDDEVDEAPKKKGVKAVETRKLFSDFEREAWYSRNSLYHNASGCYASTQYIDDWFAAEKRWSHTHLHSEMLELRYTWGSECTDTAKGLMLEAALVLKPLNERQAARDDSDAARKRHTDTLFLMTHHPRLDRCRWQYGECNCCNLNAGMLGLIESVLTGYLYLNILFAMREAGSSICDLTDHVIDRPQELHRFRRYRTLLRPRPKYMNTKSWTKVLIETCRPHENRQEVMVFEPFFYPQPGTTPWVAVEFDSPRPSLYDPSHFQEADFMSPGPSPSDVQADPLLVRGSPEALREFLRGLWRLLVMYEMLWNDQGRAPRWEVMVAETLDECFHNIGGGDWLKSSVLRTDCDRWCGHDTEHLFDLGAARVGHGDRDDSSEEEQEGVAEAERCLNARKQRRLRARGQLGQQRR